MTDKPLRSQAWFGRQGKMEFYYRSVLEICASPLELPVSPDTH